MMVARGFLTPPKAYTSIDALLASKEAQDFLSEWAAKLVPFGDTAQIGEKKAELENAIRTKFADREKSGSPAYAFNEIKDYVMAVYRLPQEIYKDPKKEGE